MLHHRNGLPSKSHPGAISTLLFTVFLLLTHYCGGQSHMVGSSQPIVAVVGDDITLPCHLEPAADIDAETLEWARLDLKPRFVHVRRDGVELLVNQNPLYVGRTSLSSYKLKHGDMSLELSKVRLADQGTYRCHVPTLGTSTVQLVVGAVSSPVVIIAEIDAVSSGLVLRCESAGWYPEPEVWWLDGEGNLLSAESTETDRGPDGLYTVSSRVTVDKRHSNSFTCRVQQENINQTRETHIRIPEDVFVAPSSSAVRIIVVFSVSFLLFAAAFFLVCWKLRRNKGNKKQRHVGAEGTVKMQLVVEGLRKMKDDEKAKLDERLQGKEEELEDIMYVISVLMEQKKELENYRDKLMSQLEDMEKERQKKEKKIKSLNTGFTWNKDVEINSLQKLIQELENKSTEYKELLQITVKRLQKTNDVITRITERKNKVENNIEQMRETPEEVKRPRGEIQPQSETEEDKITDQLLMKDDNPPRPDESKSQKLTSGETKK